MQFFIILFAALSLTHQVFAQCDSIKIVFYNVENLFDIEDDSLKNDNEFLPFAKKNWNEDKFNKKITRVVKVIAANNFPDIIGLSEIENATVLKEIINHFQLKKQHYRIVHFESGDQRGIDCALLYNSNKWHLHSLKPYPVVLKGRPTRDILSATLVNDRDTLALLVNHWPSRFGGRKASQPKRMAAAQVLLQVMDSITKQFPTKKVIAMGDFNDEPKDSSLQLLNGFSNQSEKFKGTLKYRGRWQTFDQFICSTNFNYLSYPFRKSFLLEEDKTYGGYKPFRTYYGPIYHNGFSDHLPIVLTFCAP
ncbi:MAG: endonuclease [Flavobacteriales bacterium]|nr:endonuclease [Flavobacteriales bacterium]|tara:strand:+ start:44098 stop:45018 length:921 start_codon:yes stop_codon:yes gene_type:complete